MYNSLDGCNVPTIFSLKEQACAKDWLLIPKVHFNVLQTAWSAHLFAVCLFSDVQAILREGLEEVKQFFSINSTCRLPLNPGLFVKGINIQVQIASFYIKNLEVIVLFLLTHQKQNVSLILSSCSLAPTSTLMRCPSSSRSRTRIL